MQIDKLIDWNLVLVPVSVTSWPCGIGYIRTLRFFGVRIAVWVSAR